MTTNTPRERCRVQCRLCSRVLGVCICQHQPIHWVTCYDDNTDHKGNYVYFDYYDGKDSFDGGAVALSALLNRLVEDMHPKYPEQYPWWTDRSATGGDMTNLKKEYLEAALASDAKP